MDKITIEFIKQVLDYLHAMGGAIVEASAGILDILQLELVEGFRLWQLMTGVFAIVYVPYTILKWLIPV